MKRTYSLSTSTMTGMAMHRSTYLAAIWLAILLTCLCSPVQAQTVTVEYIHTDALGSPVAVTNEAGQVIERTLWEPYGAAIGKPNYDGPGYTGHVMDGATGLTYMQQRYYDPSIGRFLSTDPVTAYEKPMTNFNRYVYALNNPYRFTDPDGRDSVGEMIDSGANGCGAVSCAGWAAGKALWTVFGAEGVSQVSDKGSDASTGDKIMAGIEVGTLGLGGKVGAGIRAVMGFAKEASPVARLSGQLAKEFGASSTLAKNGAGNVFKLADGKVTVRVMESGGGRTNYLRVSVEGKGSVDAAGRLSSDPAKTHIPIGKDSLNMIKDVVNKYSQ